MSDFNFTCPYCSHPTTITDPNFDRKWVKLNLMSSKLGAVGLSFFAITCPNRECNQLTLKMSLTKSISRKRNGYDYEEEGAEINTWNLLPESDSKVIPDYIPQAIRDDYYEACRICQLSPKASATLARRCLQGMIRDFWKISKSRLKDEVDALEGKVDDIVWKAIDGVRSVGNIGAHMEKDVNYIVTCLINILKTHA